MSNSDPTPTWSGAADLENHQELSYYTTESKEFPQVEQKHGDSMSTGPGLSTQITDLFVSTANTVGHAMNLDGLLFFDAIPPGPQDMGDKSTQAGTCADDPLATSLAEYWNNAAARQQLFYRPSQSLLRRLIADCAQGRLFVIDEHGVLDDQSNDIADMGQHTRGSAAYKSWDSLVACIPNARYAIFLPLWHYQREVCFATCLVWVNDVGKTLDHGDVSSLTAFGNSLMAEVFRLEAATNTQAKSDFVSSISHELRSPLHGILATTELIQNSDSAQDPELLAMVDMIESCGNTLLDTFNHLLEFSNINSRPSNVQSVDGNTPKS